MFFEEISQLNGTPIECLNPTLQFIYSMEQEDLNNLAERHLNC